MKIYKLPNILFDDKQVTYKAEVATVVYGNNYRKASEVIDEFAKRIKERALHSCHKIINCYEVTRIETVIDDIADEMRQEVER